VSPNIPSPKHLNCIMCGGYMHYALYILECGFVYLHDYECLSYIITKICKYNYLIEVVFTHVKAQKPCYVINERWIVH
jgi:hypothetical protein